MSEKEAKIKWDTLHNLLAEAKSKLMLINTDTNVSTEIKAIARLNETSTNLTRRANSLISKAFNLHQQMSGTTLCEEWDTMVQQHCFSVG